MASSTAAAQRLHGSSKPHLAHSAGGRQLGLTPTHTMRRTHEHSVWSVQQEEEEDGAKRIHVGGAGLMAPGDRPAVRLSLGAMSRPAASTSGGLVGEGDSPDFTVAPDTASSSRDTLRRAGSARSLNVIIEDEDVVCPDCLRSMDTLLSKPNGTPTTLYRISQLFCAIQGPHILIGTFISPGVMVAVEAEDKLMGLAIIGVAAMVVGSVFILEEARRAIRLGGPLTKLGAGSRQIPHLLYMDIEKTLRKFHPSRPPFIAKLVLYGILFGVVIIFPQIGIQEPWHNRISAVLWFMFYLFGNTVIAIWIISMKLATILSGHAVRAVITTIDLTTDMENWTTTVCAPAMELAAQTMPALSIGWGRSVVVYTGCAILGIISFFALGLSPEVHRAMDNIWWPMASRCIAGICIAICTVFPLFVASGPAHVSSQCEELMEALNELRSDRSRDLECIS